MTACPSFILPITTQDRPRHRVHNFGSSAHERDLNWLNNNKSEGPSPGRNNRGLYGKTFAPAKHHER